MARDKKLGTWVPIKRVKERGRFYGILYERPDGSRVYLAHRRQKEMWRNKERTISKAIIDGTAGWALDVDTIIMAKKAGVVAIGVVVKETGDIYLTDPANYELASHGGKALPHNYQGIGEGTVQRLLHEKYFVRRVGAVKL